MAEDKAAATEEATPQNEEKAEKKEAVKVSASAKKIIESIETMTVLELSELVKALEDKFGVVAAAPMAAAAAPAGGAEGDADAGPTTVSVVLTSAGDKKIQVLKAVREITGLGLKEAKELVDSVPKAVKEDIKKEEAEEIKGKIEAQGGTVEIK